MENAYMTSDNVQLLRNGVHAIPHEFTKITALHDLHWTEQSTSKGTEQASEAVTQSTCIPDETGSYLGRCLPQSVWANPRIVP